MHKLAVYEYYFHHKITLDVQASDDAIYGTRSQLSFTASKAQLPNGQELPGRISVSGFGLNSVFQGDEVEVSGTLSPALGAQQAQLSFAKLTLVGHHPSLIAEIRRKFAAGMQSALPEPSASFAMGLLIGQRATLPASVKQDLLMVGLTHIIAVSGYNLTIILQASRQLLARQSKRLSTGLSLGLIAGFLLLAGSSASIVRAAIVSVLSIMTAYYGRSFKPLNLLALAAVITAWANPSYIWRDTSWYLSFLAFYGVMVVAPAVSRNWPKRWRESIVLSVALESICAELMTLPFILHTFGQMSFVGLPANVLVTALVPLAMLLSLVAGLSGMLASSLAGWLAWPAQSLLTYMLDTAHLLSRIPHVFVQHLGFSLTEMVACYGGIGLLGYALWRRTKPRQYAKITDQNERSQQMVNN